MTGKNSGDSEVHIKKTRAAEADRRFQQILTAFGLFPLRFYQHILVLDVLEHSYSIKIQRGPDRDKFLEQRSEIGVWWLLSEETQFHSFHDRLYYEK